MQTHRARQLLIKNSGALNDGFLAVNATQSTFRSLEIMYSKRRYKICICSVILGELESFRNNKGLSIIFPKILDVI